MIELIKRVVAEMLNMQARTQYGIISAYDPDHYTVKVTLQPDEVDTGWMPLGSMWVGDGLGAVFGPIIGTPCRVDFIDGVPEATLCGARFFNANNPPPIVQSGEAAIVDAAGSYLRLNNDGTITTKAGTSMTFDTPLLTVTGDIEDSVGTLAAVRTAHNGHTHTDPQGGNTGGPSLTA